MRYELYADSLLFLNFVMNYYILLTVDRLTFRTATRKRLLAGAGVGSVGFLLPFLMPGMVVIRLVLGILTGVCGMLLCTFRVKDRQGFCLLLSRTLSVSFALGGCLLFLWRGIPDIDRYLPGITGVLLAGGVVTLLAKGQYTGTKEKEQICFVTLKRENRELRVPALIDTGNSLTEPLSGKPVCILDRELFESVWQRNENGFRVIPYHSIGKRGGILEGYLFPEVILELQGIEKVCADVCVAISPEPVGGAQQDSDNRVKMILHPQLSMGRAGKSHRGWRKKGYDIKGCNSGENADPSLSQGETSAQTKGRNPLHRRRRDPAAAVRRRAGDHGHQ